MANIRDSLAAVMQIDSAETAVLLNFKEGTVLGRAGGSEEAELEAAANLDLLKTKDKIIKLLGQHDNVNDMLITTWKSHILLRRVVTENTFGQDVMLFVKLRRDPGGMSINLAMIRFQLRRIEENLMV